MHITLACSILISFDSVGCLCEFLWYAIIGYESMALGTGGVRHIGKEVALYRAFAKKIVGYDNLRVLERGNRVSKVNLASYEADTVRKWTSSWCIGYRQALVKSIELVDRVLFDAMLKGIEADAALETQRKQLVRKLAVVDLFMSKR